MGPSRETSHPSMETRVAALSLPRSTVFSTREQRKTCETAGAGGPDRTTTNHGAYGRWRRMAPSREVMTCHKGTVCAAQAQKAASMSERIRWPDGKDFAFTIFDDTDCATYATVRDVYAFLRDCGLRTTKSVWPVRAASTRRSMAGTPAPSQSIGPGSLSCNAWGLKLAII